MRRRGTGSTTGKNMAQTAMKRLFIESAGAPLGPKVILSHNRFDQKPPRSVAILEGKVISGNFEVVSRNKRCQRWARQRRDWFSSGKLESSVELSEAARRIPHQPFRRGNRRRHQVSLKRETLRVTEN